MKLSDHFQTTDCLGLPQIGEDGDRGTTVYLAIFEDRVEIRNPGDFPSELNTKKLFTPPQELSIPRNPLIANVLYMRKSIETWGRGLGVMAEECRRVGLPLPVTDVKGGFVVTTFRRPEAAVGSGSGSNLDQRDPDPILIDPDIPEELSLRLLEIVRFNPLVSRKMLAVELDVSERKVRETINKLKDAGVILRQGADHGGIWRISRIIKNSVNGDTQGDTQGVGNVGNRVGNDVGNCVGNEPGGRDIANEVLSAIRADVKVSAARLAKRFAVSCRTIERVMSDLRKDGRIRRVGGTRGTWLVVEDHV